MPASTGCAINRDRPLEFRTRFQALASDTRQTGDHAVFDEASNGPALGKRPIRPYLQRFCYGKLPSGSTDGGKLTRSHRSKMRSRPENGSIDCLPIRHRVATHPHEDIHRFFWLRHSWIHLCNSLQTGTTGKTKPGPSNLTARQWANRVSRLLRREDTGARTMRAAGISRTTRYR